MCDSCRQWLARLAPLPFFPLLLVTAALGGGGKARKKNENHSISQAAGCNLSLPWATALAASSGHLSEGSRLSTCTKPQSPSVPAYMCQGRACLPEPGQQRERGGLPRQGMSPDGQSQVQRSALEGGGGRWSDKKDIILDSPTTPPSPGTATNLANVWPSGSLAR